MSKLQGPKGQDSSVQIRASERISTGISLRPRITSVLRQSASVELLITSTWYVRRTLSVATVVAKLKVSSNLAVRERYLSQFSWQSGYAAFSVSESTLEAVTQYVFEQETHHKTVTFQDEYRAFLKRHNVSFDERYVWD